MEINILIVDDQYPDLFRQHLALMNGFVITTCRSGSEAVRIVRSQAVDLVLMDIRLPAMNGLKAIKLIREFDRDVVIIAMTAYSDRKTRKTALEAGADDYFVKPPNYRALHQRMIELVVERPGRQPANHKERLEKQRRLNLLREQAARKGLDTEPHILTEIEDLETELNE